MFSLSRARPDADLPPLHEKLNSMTLSNNNNISTSDHNTRELPADFQPTLYSVICGSGRHNKAFDSVGNRRFRVTATMFQDRYAVAQSRYERSLIVTQIIDIVHNVGGGFVKYEKKKGNGSKWYNVSETMAREMVEAVLFRDCLGGGRDHHQYRPGAASNQSKAARRKSQQSIGDNNETVSICTTTNTHSSNQSSTCCGSDEDLLDESERT